ncbi:uncharacterized protein METZ01_LOCUS271840, partial [marine metagenome]
NKRFNTPHILLTFLLFFGAAPIIAGKDLRYIIMLGGGLVFIYDLIPLFAAFRFAKILPEAFAVASMKMPEQRLKIISAIGMGILVIQGSLSFSDIDRTGWLLVIVYIIAVLIYIRIRNRYRLPTSAQYDRELSNT